MVTVLLILLALAALASLVFFIMVLIRLFQEKGALHGILGIFCSLYTFIWGWINADRLGIKQTMIYWTAATVAIVILQVLAGVMGAGSMGVPAVPQP